MVGEERKNILLLIPHLGSGGAENSVSKLSQLLSKKHKVFLCTFERQIKVKYPIGGSLIFLSESLIQNPVLRWYNRFKVLKAVKEELGIDVCISFLEGANYLNVLTRKNEKIIISVRGSFKSDLELSGIGGLVRRHLLIKGLFRKADMVVSVALALTKEMQRYFAIPTRKCTTITNSYDIQSVKQMASLGLSTAHESLFNKPVIINVGRLHPQKEQARLITVFAEVRKKTDVRLLILGSGGLETTLIRTAADLNLRASTTDLNADVVLLGFQQNPYVFIKSSTVFAFPSAYEGFPNALAESMIVGCPVLAADCPTGPYELMVGQEDLSYKKRKEPLLTENGILMPLIKGSEDVWARELYKVLKKQYPLKKYSANASRSMQRFDTSRVYDQWESIVND